jgi:hypothetical protein
MEAQPLLEQKEVLPAGGERHEVASQSNVAPVAPPPIPALPTPLPQNTDSTIAPATDDNPIKAADDDLIEREWVDKAKRIVRDTRADPYQQEAKVSKLQADYLKKRYGKNVGISD